MSCPNPDNKSTTTISCKCSLVSNPFINYGNENDTSLPLQTNGDQTGFGNCKGNITSDFVYMGCSYNNNTYSHICICIYVKPIIFLSYLIICACY